MEVIIWARRPLVLFLFGVCFFCMGFLFGDLHRDGWNHWPNVTMDPALSKAFRERSATDAFTSLPVRASDIVLLENLFAEASSWNVTTRLTHDLLAKREALLAAFASLSSLVLRSARLSFHEQKYERLRQTTNLIDASQALLIKRLQLIQPLVVGQLVTAAMTVVGDSAFQELVVTVAERPFGMMLKPFSRHVGEVFPGFPAQLLGLRRGCEVLKMGGVVAEPVSCLHTFQRMQLPFELSLRCPPETDSRPGIEPFRKDPRQYRVMVVKKPFGMNIQVIKVPRVTQVMPGYPAEVAGVQRGFVLTEVDNKPVNGSNWLTRFVNTPLPFALTFDTTSPLMGVGANQLQELVVSVGERPFGMTLHPFSTRVKEVFPGLPAKRLGVRRGCDVMKVAGVMADPVSCMQALRQAHLPYELSLRCPPQEESTLDEGPLSKLPRRYRVMVVKKPFGVEIPVKTVPRVVRVVPGSPAESAGVKRGFTLIEVDDTPVSKSDWGFKFNNTPLPFTLTFNTTR